MPFIKRENGLIVSIYNRAVVGDAEEFLPDNNAEIIAFRTVPPPPTLQEREITAEELADILVDGRTLNRGQITAKKNARTP